MKKFPILTKRDVIIGDFFLQVDKLTEDYESRWDYHLFEDEIELKANAMVDYSNFDDLGCLVIAIRYFTGNHFDMDVVASVFLETYQEFIKKQS